MAIEQLSEEQVRQWTREEKDRWWLEHVYRGDMPQLTVRSAITGFVLGGVLAATRGHVIWVEGYESICAGLISGSALVGIGNAIVNVLL